ncbi:MAG: hypothetical protein LQ351_004306 [Letrouitia transgressa]|nr:MAG: hypothetical protein LQ351_004306 [Letrouitia transgressa]
MNKTATTIPFDPDCTTFPKRKDVPRRKDALPEAAWVWGENDYVRTALPLSVPETPSFGRETFKHEIKDLAQGKAHDDLYSLNTQSGTQWDGLRHVSHLATGTFYNGTTASDITGPNANKKCSIHYLAEHGIAGRGVLLDYKTYANKKGIQYSSFTDHRIPYEELYLCGQDQGLDIRPEAQGGDIKVGDLLFIRTGFVEAYYNLKSSEEWAKVALRPHEIGPNDDQKWAGVAQEEAIIDWLHDCYFAAVAGDAPAFETWPTNKGKIDTQQLCAYC